MALSLLQFGIELVSAGALHLAAQCVIDLAAARSRFTARNWASFARYCLASGVCGLPVASQFSAKPLSSARARVACASPQRRRPYADRLRPSIFKSGCKGSGNNPALSSPCVSALWTTTPENNLRTTRRRRAPVPARKWPNRGSSCNYDVRLHVVVLDVPA